MPTSDTAAKADVLAELGLVPEHVCDLARQQRDQLLSFLSDWEHHTELLACANALLAARPRLLISSLDMRTRALLGLQRYDEALAAIQERLAHKDSFTGRSLLSRVHLARGDAQAARDLAQAMVQGNPGSLVAWKALAEVELAEGSSAAAMAAYRHIGEIAPQDRDYLLGMATAYQLSGDWVTASGFAVRLLATASEVSPLPVTHLRWLRTFFQASGETTRVADLDEELARRYAEDLAALRQALASLTSAPARPRVEPVELLRQIEPLSPAEQVSVRADERALIEAAAKEIYGFESLKPGQMETIACVLRGESVLTVLPTGGGKSLCYQLPAFLDQQGTTLVISPLIALMQDQLEHVPEKVRDMATFVNSSLDGDELRQRLGLIAGGCFRLVYAAPERLRQPPFLHALRRAGVNRLVIDEAHCVSIWGHDFRPDYLAIGKAREALGSPPLLALTATAPERVRRDILRHLGEMRIVARDVTRPNLRFEVFYARDLDEKLGRLLAFCKSEVGSGIVYAGTRERCEELAALLRAQGVEAGYYHAGIADRESTQDGFMTGRVRVVVATIAFGLGIDKPDIRFVVHFAPPASLENYYQEAGRAGRDGLPARCLLMYSTADKSTLTRWANKDTLPVEFLCSVYSAVRQRLNGAACGRVAAADLERDLRAEELRVRVALGFLEQAGLLQRGPDVPRAATVRLALAAAGADSPQFAAFCQAARLRLGQSLTVDLTQVARQASLPLDGIESHLLEWASAGWLSYRPSGRDLLLVLPPEPTDTRERMARLLEGYQAIQVQRVQDIVAYAQTHRCRHGYINAYLGGRTIKGCAACDNCVGISPPPDCLPTESEQLKTILSCLAASRWGWGRASLVRILRGDREAPPAGQDSPSFGALAFRSETAIAGMVGRLESAGLLQPRQLDHGGIVLEVTSAGRRALQRPETLAELAQSRRPSLPVKPARATELDGPVDQALFQALREWRLEQARSQSVPPYVVFSDDTLRAIAATQPATLAALAKIRGVGPVKLAKYGEAVLELIQQAGVL